MGFEVIDSRGQAPTAGRVPGSSPVADVVELDDVDAPSPVELDAGRPGAVTSSGRALLRERRTLLRLLLVAVVVAAVAGGVIGRRSATIAEDRRAAATLAVAAQAVGETPYELAIGLGAQLDVRVTNLGPRPVRLGQAGPGSPGTRTATVQVLGESWLPAGDSVTVLVRTSVDCRVGRVLTPRIGVTTEDGVEHTTAVTMPDGGRPSDRLCPRRSNSSALSASLVGTVQLPALQLSNLTADPLRVSLPEQGLFPYRDGRVLEVVTRPLLPTTIRPNDRLIVRLRLVSHGCVAELQDVQRLDLATLTIAGTALRTGGQEQVEVDMTALVSAAMVRSCG